MDGPAASPRAGTIVEVGSDTRPRARAPRRAGRGRRRRPRGPRARGGLPAAVRGSRVSSTARRRRPPAARRPPTSPKPSSPAASSTSRGALARADVLLELVGRLDRGGRHEDALRLARVLVRLLTLLQRWAGLARTLHAGLRAAEALGDGRPRRCSGTTSGRSTSSPGGCAEADDQLEAARELRARLGDRRGPRGDGAHRGAPLPAPARAAPRGPRHAAAPPVAPCRARAGAAPARPRRPASAIGARDEDPPARARRHADADGHRHRHRHGTAREFTVDVDDGGRRPRHRSGARLRRRLPGAPPGRMRTSTLTAAPGAGQHLERLAGRLRRRRTRSARSRADPRSPGRRVLRDRRARARDDPREREQRRRDAGACSPSCEAEIGSTVRIEASVEDGFTSISWTGCTRSERARCEVDVTGDAEVVAVRSQPEPPVVD